MDPCKLSAVEIASAVRSKKISAVEVWRAFAKRIEQYNPTLNAFLTVNSQAEMQAQEIDRKIAAGQDPGPLAGVPIGIKDNIVTQRITTTCASRILEGWVPPYDAFVVRRMKEAGAIIAGKTNLDEFAMGGSNENSAFGAVRNPWQLDRVPGGSSGGSAAAVAARMVPLALGSDTGGSVRQPASFCHLVGLKPTYGRVSRYGLVAFASSLDQIGPLARNTTDAEVLFNVIAGHDPQDSTSLRPQDVSIPDHFTGTFRLGLVREFFAEGLNTHVRAVVENAVADLHTAGMHIQGTTLPSASYGVAVYQLLATSEASSNLSRYDGVRYGFRAHNTSNLESMYTKTRGQGFGAEVKRRILLGTYALSAGYYDAYYRKAQQVRTLIRREVSEALQHYDLLLGPTVPIPPFGLGELIDDPLTMYLADTYAVIANLAGVPALSIPAGFTPEGLPVGMQMMAKAGHEATLFAFARTWEELHPELFARMANAFEKETVL